MQSPVTRQEIEQKMDELAREYHDTHDPEIPEQILELGQAASGEGPLKGPGLVSRVRFGFMD
jgi:hypothetical protein